MGNTTKYRFLESETAQLWVSLGLAVVAVLLLVAGISSIYRGVKALAGGGARVSEAARETARRYAALPDSPLPGIQDALDRVAGIYLGLGSPVLVKEAPQGKNKAQDKKDQEPVWGESGIDQIGQYKDVLLNMEGDIFEQLWLLKTIEEQLYSVMLVKGVAARATGITVEGRVYGAK